LFISETARLGDAFRIERETLGVAGAKVAEIVLPEDTESSKKATDT
jgi:hypothetical protein